MSTGELEVVAGGATRRGAGGRSVRMLVGPVVAVVAVLGLGGLLVFTPGSLVFGYLGLALAALGVPYTLVAVVVGVVARIRIAPREPVPGRSDEARDRAVQEFGLFAQRASLALAVALLALLAVAVIADATSPPGTSGISHFGFSALAAAGAVFAGAVFTIGANIPQLYHRRVIALERHAVATRTGAWRLIVISWIASPTLWITYSATTLAVALPFLLGG